MYLECFDFQSVKFMRRYNDIRGRANSGLMPGLTWTSFSGTSQRSSILVAIYICPGQNCV